MKINSFDTIWKFRLYVQGQQPVHMPKESKILDFQRQQGQLVIWAAVNSNNDPEERMFHIIGTGQPIPENIELTYIGTVQDDNFVWHLFEEV